MVKVIRPSLLDEGETEGEPLSALAENVVNEGTSISAEPADDDDEMDEWDDDDPEDMDGEDDDIDDFDDEEEIDDDVGDEEDDFA